MAEEKINVNYINADGAGYSEQKEVVKGVTITGFMSEHLNGRSASEFVIRVNNAPVRVNYVLEDGDQVVVSPKKIAGA